MTERYSEIKLLIDKALTLLEEEMEQTKRDIAESLRDSQQTMIQEIKAKDNEIEYLKAELAKYKSSDSSDDEKLDFHEEEEVVEKNEEEKLELFPQNDITTQQEEVTSEEYKSEDTFTEERIIDSDFDFFGDSATSSIFEVIEKGSSTKGKILGELFQSRDIIGERGLKSPRWQTDRPGPKVEDLDEAITLNDKLYFIRELFAGDEEQFDLTIERIQDCDNLDEIISEMRITFPEWDEDSDAVYRFYMAIRRKF